MFTRFMSIDDEEALELSTRLELQYVLTTYCVYIHTCKGPRNDNQDMPEVSAMNPENLHAKTTLLGFVMLENLIQAGN